MGEEEWNKKKYQRCSQIDLRSKTTQKKEDFRLAPSAFLGV